MKVNENWDKDQIAKFFDTSELLRKFENVKQSEKKILDFKINSINKNKVKKTIKHISQKIL